MAIRSQSELMVRHAEEQKILPLRPRALKMPEDMIQNKGIHGSITGKRRRVLYVSII